MSTVFRTFGWSLAITVVGVALAGLLGGPQAAAVVAILAVLEISLSFDNAVVNATILQRMNPWWQRIFLTVGVVIAVFGMRLLFPLLIVGITAHLGPVAVVDLALNNATEYGHRLEAAHPAIAAFGGMFLLMIFLNFVFESREHTWFGPLERGLARIGRLDTAAVLVAGAALIVAAETLTDGNKATILLAGLAGLLAYLLVDSLSSLFEAEGEEGDGDDPDDVLETDGIHGAAQAPRRQGVGAAVLATGKAAFFLFLYLEVLDASFSFDGVVGAFAISNNIFVIAAGLGIGAMYIRSLTVYLVRQGTLSEYVYLEHGAHYAIGALAILLLLTIRYQVPEVVTGLIGVGFIGLALVSSIVRNRRVAGEQSPEPERTPVAVR